MDNGIVPPMSPDDFAALAAFAGPIYQESRVIESFTSNNPIPNAHDNYGSMNIKQGLEQAQRLAQASLVRPQPLYVPPAVQIEDTFSASYVHPTPTYIQPTPQLPTPDPSDQLEFSFSSSKQDVTNDLLREISKKLTKLINLVEKQEGGAKLDPKFKQHVKQNQV